MNAYYRNYKMNIIITLSQKVVYIRNTEITSTAKTKGETIWPKKKVSRHKISAKGKEREGERQTDRQTQQEAEKLPVSNKLSFRRQPKITDQECEKQGPL